MAARGLGHVLDQYIAPPRSPAGAQPIACIFVPLLAGDAQAGGIVAALADGVRASGRSCSLRAHGPRGAALLPPGAAGPGAGAEIALEVGVEPSDSPADAVLLLLLPGWESRAALAWSTPGARSGRARFLLIDFGDAHPRDSGWAVAALAPTPAYLGQVPAEAGLRDALGLGRTRAEGPFAALARRLIDLATPPLSQQVCPPPGAFSLRKHASG